MGEKQLIIEEGWVTENNIRCYCVVARLNGEVVAYKSALDESSARFGFEMHLTAEAKKATRKFTKKETVYYYK